MLTEYSKKKSHNHDFETLNLKKSLFSRRQGVFITTLMSLFFAAFAAKATV